jgi:hypothetical protein
MKEFIQYLDFGVKQPNLLRTLFLCAFCILTNVTFSLATIYEVGTGQPYPTISSLPSLIPGDIVNIHPGIYNEVKKWTDSGTLGNPITLRGVGTPRPVIDANKQNVTGKKGTPRAAWEIQGNYYVIENLEFTNARNNSYNGAGIRVLFANFTTVRNCKITFCDMGMMSSSNDNLLVEYTEVAFNGTRKFNGFSHNFYLAGGNSVIQFCYIHDAPYGQNFKTRGHYTDLLYNYIADSNEGEVGPVDGTDTTAANSNMTMIGNIVVSKPDRTGNTGKFINFGQDSGGSHNGRLYLVNNTLVAGSPSIQFLTANASDGTIVAINNIFRGSGVITPSSDYPRVSGWNNFMESSATVPPGFTTPVIGDPGFLSESQRDFHLISSSVCRNVGDGSPTYQDGSGVSHSAVPTLEYVNHLQSKQRASDGLIDSGAYEFP